MEWKQAKQSIQATRTLHYSPSTTGTDCKARCNFKMLWSCSNIISKSCQLFQNTKADCSYPSFLLTCILVQREQLRIGVSGAKSHTSFFWPKAWGGSPHTFKLFTTSLPKLLRLYYLILQRNLCYFSLQYLWPAIHYSLTAAYFIKVRNV